VGHLLHFLVQVQIIWTILVPDYSANPLAGSFGFGLGHFEIHPFSPFFFAAPFPPNFALFPEVLEQSSNKHKACIFGWFV
jgi:hypothetical protein